MGNVGSSTVTQVRIDGAKPDTEQFIGLPETIKATKTASGQWQAQIGALVGDTGSGLDPSAVRMLLRQQENVGEAQQEQLATFSGSGALWLSNYLFDASLADPTGVYTFTVKARDLMGNEAENYIQVLRVDVSGPDAFLSANDAAREVISQTITIGGVVTDSKSIVGVDKVEIAFTPIEQVLALPNNIAADAAEAQLNRPWNVATLAQAGQPSTSWSYPLSNTLEGIYQIDLACQDRQAGQCSYPTPTPGVASSIPLPHA